MSLPQNLRTHPALPWIAALAVMLMWASSFVVIRAGGLHLSPGAMSLLRIGAAAVALLPLVVLGRVRVPRTGRLRVAVAVWGVAWFAAYTIVLNASEALIDAATAAMVVNIAPLIVAVVSGAVFGEGLPPRLIAGVLVAFGGIALITVATSTGHVSGLGIVLGIVAALLYAGSVLAQKRLLAHIDSTSMTVIGIGAGFLACLPYSPQLVSEFGDMPRGFVIAVVYMGVFPTAVAFLLWGYALTRTPAGILTSSSLLVPAFTVGLAWLLLGEMPPLLAGIGGILCVTGAGFAIVPSVVAALRSRRDDPSLEHTDPSPRHGESPLRVQE